MEVYQDLFMYRSGVYKRSQFSGHMTMGFHSVKIIGWGEEGDAPYWVKKLLEPNVWLST